MPKIFTLTTPKAGTKITTSSEDITEVRIRRINIRKLQDSPVIQVVWAEGSVISTVFTVQIVQNARLSGDDATDVLDALTLGPPKQSVQSNIEQTVLQKLEDLGLIDAGTIS